MGLITGLVLVGWGGSVLLPMSDVHRGDQSQTWNPTRLRRQSWYSATAEMGQTLPSDGHSAKDRFRAVSGSPSAGSRASAERRQRTFWSGDLTRRVRPEAAVPPLHFTCH